MKGILFIATLFVKIKNGFQNTLHILFPRLFAKDVDVYYSCLSKIGYVTVTLTRTRKGGKLKTDNGIYVLKECKEVGILLSQRDVYGYAIFKHGYLLFGGVHEQTHFGYGMYKSLPVYHVHQSVSTFCTYVPLTKENLIEKISLLEVGNTLNAGSSNENK